MMANFPDKFEKLSIYCQVLPMGALAPVQPFSGIVLNLCVSTRAHRDSMDDLLCVVIPLGKFTGGELCLHEAGLVFEGRSGDVIIFRSQEQTHFNLYFKGVRASIVLHSDKHSRSWTENWNGWGPHIHESSA